MLAKDIFQVIAKYFDNPFDYFEFLLISKKVNQVCKKTKRYKKMEKQMDDLKERKVEYFINLTAKICKIDKNKIIKIFDKVFQKNNYDGSYPTDSEIDYDLEIRDELTQIENEDDNSINCYRMYRNKSIDPKKIDDNGDEYFMKIVRNMNVDVVFSWLYARVEREIAEGITTYDKNNYIIYARKY